MMTGTIGMSCGDCRTTDMNNSDCGTTREQYGYYGTINVTGSDYNAAATIGKSAMTGLGPLM